MRIRTRASPPLKAEHSTANADSTRVRSDAFSDGGPFSPRACRVRGASSARHPTPHRIPNARRARSALPESAAKRTWCEGRRSSGFDPFRTCTYRMNAVVVTAMSGIPRRPNSCRVPIRGVPFVSFRHPVFYRYRASDPRRNRSLRNCCPRVGDGRSEVPACV